MSDSNRHITVYSAPFSEDSRDSHALLYRAAEKHTGLTASELGPLTHTPLGKPSFSLSPHIHFSITHSGDRWLCGFSDAPLGIDLQIHRSYTPPARLSQRFFHPLEDAFLAADDYARFFDLWCAKESWVKYTGQGFFDDPGSFSVVSGDGVFPVMEGVVLELLPFAEGYSLCICSKSPSEIHFSTL